MIALRYTSTKDETGFNSEDQRNGGFFNGLCCYDITDAVDDLINNDYDFDEAVMLCARKQAEFDNWFATNSKGQFVIFEGEKTGFDTHNQDRFGNRAVIARLKKYEAIGTIIQNKYGYCNGSIELN